MKHRRRQRWRGRRGTYEQRETSPTLSVIGSTVPQWLGTSNVDNPNQCTRPAVPIGTLTEPPPPPFKDAIEGKGPQRRPQKRLDRRLEEAAKAAGGGDCRLQMPLKRALAVRETQLEIGWAPWSGGGGGAHPLPMQPCLPHLPPVLS